MANYIDKLEEFTDEYVPYSGKAPTVGGEILRAVNRIIYRFYNDGDRFWEDYGVETCGSSAYYLTTVGGSLAQWVTDNTGEEYEKREIENLVKAAVITLEKFPQLFEEKNYKDSTSGFKTKAEEVFKPYNDFGEDDEDY